MAFAIIKPKNHFQGAEELGGLVMEYRAFHLWASELNPVQATRDSELLPSSDCSAACVKWAGGLRLYQMASHTPTKRGPRNCKRKCRLENKTPVFRSRVRKLGWITPHKVALKKEFYGRHEEDGEEFTHPNAVELNREMKSLYWTRGEGLCWERWWF